MIWAWLLSLLVGMAGVVQGGINRNLSRQWDFATVVLLNCLVVLSFSLLFFIWNRYSASSSALGSAPQNLGSFPWWAYLGGFFGFVIVVGIPLGIRELGALRFFVVVITSQLLASAAWDYWAEAIPLTATRVVGALLAVAAALLVAR